MVRFLESLIYFQRETSIHTHEKERKGHIHTEREMGEEKFYPQGLGQTKTSSPELCLIFYMGGRGASTLYILHCFLRELDWKQSSRYSNCHFNMGSQHLRQ